MIRSLLKALSVVFCLTAVRELPAENHAFLWTPGSGMQDLGTLGGSTSYGTGVNDSGTVVGFSETLDGLTHAFLWTAAEGMQDLGEPPGGRYNILLARAINNRDEIVGLATLFSGQSAAFYWSDPTGFILLTRGNVDAYGINDLGTATGIIERGAFDQAFLWNPSRGQFKGLGFLSGGTYSVGYDVSNLGNVAGQVETSPGEFHPMFWSPATGFVDLGVPSAGYFGLGERINDNDELVGQTWDSTTGDNVVAFYWSQTTGRVDLVTLPERPSSNANDINNRGMIVGLCASDRRPSRAVLWETYTSNPRNLGVLPGGYGSAALGLNNRGQVTGWADAP